MTSLLKKKFFNEKKISHMYESTYGVAGSIWTSEPPCLTVNKKDRARIHACAFGHVFYLFY